MAPNAAVPGAGRGGRARYHHADASRARACQLAAQRQPANAAASRSLARQKPFSGADRTCASVAGDPGGARMSTGTITWVEALEQRVRHVLAENDLDGLRVLLVGRHPSDIADVIDRLDDEDKVKVFRLLTHRQAADVLDETSGDATRELLENLPKEEVGDLLDSLPIDDVAEILAEDVPERQQELLAAMEPRDAAEVRTLLSYPPQSAGRLMTDKFVRVRPEMTAGETIAYLRLVDPEIESLVDLYVLSEDRHLLGVVSLRAVISAPPERELREIMITDVVTV